MLSWTGTLSVVALILKDVNLIYCNLVCTLLYVSLDKHVCQMNECNVK